MTRVTPRKLVHRGWVEAAGFLIDVELVGLAGARRRILELWSPGVQVYRVAGFYFVRLHAPRRVECEQSPGAPLVMAGGAFTAMPLAPDELSALDARSGSVIYAQGGDAVVETPAASQLEAPEDWLDLRGFAPVAVESLGLTHTAPRMVAEPAQFDARAKLDDVPAPAPELIATLTALKDEKTKGTAKSETRGASQAPPGASQGSLVRSIRDFFRGLVQERSGVAGGNRASEGAHTSPGEEWFSRAWRTAAARFLRTTRLSHLVGRRQAAYLAKMMEMFERGDINEALRHAIALEDLPTSLRSAPAFGVPRPRDFLKIQPWQTGAAASIGLDHDWMSHLQRLYRDTFGQLAAQGRIEEAAFVLAELLRANEEAVAFLERHGKLKLAAELAEARQLPAELIVRQWFVAGEVERAVRVARRTQAFAAAVTLLEKSDKKRAAELRLIWAETLARSGSYAAAVDVVWPLADERHRAKEWMGQAIELGGPAAARMLARKLSLVPEEFEEIRRHSLALLEDESYEQREARLAFAEALCRGERTPGARTLARAAVRAVLRDAGQAPHSMSSKQFRSLVDFSGDGALRTDVPPFPSTATATHAAAGQVLTHEFTSLDRGPNSVGDAAFLKDGRLLVALGEAGAGLLTRDGRTVAHFDQPAERLVISDHGDRAVALAPRGEVWRLARLDFATRRAEEWCEARIEAFAPDFDGTLWFVGVEGEFYAVDATEKGFEALWRVPEAGERVVCVTRSATSSRFLTADKLRLEKWNYQLPLLALRERTQAETRLDDESVCVKLCATLSENGVIADQSLYCRVGEAESDDVALSPLPRLRLRVFDGSVVRHEFVIGHADATPGQPLMHGQLIASPVYERRGARVRLFDLRVGRAVCVLTLEGAARVSIRLDAKTLTVADDCGRVLVLDHERNCLIRNLRV